LDGFEAPGAMSDGGLGFDDHAFESRLVWIFGSTRSGSTWLLRLLCHPLKLEQRGALGFSLPMQAATGSPLDALPVNEFLLGHHLAPLSGEPMKRGDGEYVPATTNSFWSSSPHYALSQDYEEFWRPELRRFALVRLHAIAERAAGRFPVAEDPAIVIKDVGVSHAAEITMSILPRSRFLFLVRDGRDVVDSLVHAASPGSWFARAARPLITSDDERLEFIRKKAIEWVAWTGSCQRAWDAHAGELRRMVRYEDLLADPAAQLRALYEWIGLDRDAGAIAATVSAHAFGANEPTGPTEFARAATPGLWRTNLSAEEQRIAEDVMGEKLAALGYPV
jgi:hypothetical protein